MDSSKPTERSVSTYSSNKRTLATEDGKGAESSCTRDSTMVDNPLLVVAQLEKMSELMRLQNAELDRVTSLNLALNAANEKLRSDLEGLSLDYRLNHEKSMEQDSLLTSVNIELTSLLREKQKMQERILELERKYKQAKASSMEFSKYIELQNDLFPMGTLAMPNSSVDQDLEMKKKSDDQEEIVLALDACQQEVENLRKQLDSERHYSQELHADLEKTRKMLIDRDHKVLELEQKVTDLQLSLSQNTEQLSCTQSDLQMERGRCDWLTLALHENEILIAQNRNDSVSFVEENQHLGSELKAANATIMSLQAKLEAQGAELSNTDRAIRSLRLALERRTSGN